MDQETITALRGAYKKWHLIAEGKAEDRGSLNCSLCHLFNKEGDGMEFRCIGCPIALATEKRFCTGTPYMQYTKLPNIENALAFRDFIGGLFPEGVKP